MSYFLFVPGCSMGNISMMLTVGCLVKQSEWDIRTCFGLGTGATPFACNRQVCKGDEMHLCLVRTASGPALLPFLASASAASTACFVCLLSVCYHVVQYLSAAQATRKLQDAAGQTSGNQLLVLLDALLVQRTPICGNQVCEPGERTIAGPNNLGAHAHSQMLHARCEGSMFTVGTIRWLHTHLFHPDRHDLVGDTCGGNWESVALMNHGRHCVACSVLWSP